MKQNTAEEDGIHNSIAGSPVSITCDDNPGEFSGSKFTSLPQGSGNLHGTEHQGEAVIDAAKSANQT